MLFAGLVFGVELGGISGSMGTVSSSEPLALGVVFPSTALVRFGGLLSVCWGIVDVADWGGVFDTTTLVARGEGLVAWEEEVGGVGVAVMLSEVDMGGGGGFWAGFRRYLM